MIAIVDYGMGNLGSIVNMIKKTGHECVITSSCIEINNADKLILPGVGSFDAGIINIQQLGIMDALNNKVLVEKTPILGICLGMQLMTNGSEEGVREGFGWIKADTKKFISNTFKIPHMGWNTINHTKDSKIFSEIEHEKRFYFVHGYYVDCHNNQDTLTTTSYINEFTSSFEKDNIVGVQFHPEKSHKFGMNLIKNFIENF